MSTRLSWSRASRTRAPSPVGGSIGGCGVVVAWIHVGRARPGPLAAATPLLRMLSCLLGAGARPRPMPRPRSRRIYGRAVSVEYGSSAVLLLLLPPAAGQAPHGTPAAHRATPRRRGHRGSVGCPSTDGDPLLHPLPLGRPSLPSSAASSSRPGVPRCQYSRRRLGRDRRLWACSKACDEPPAYGGPPPRRAQQAVAHPGDEAAEGGAAPRGGRSPWWEPVADNGGEPDQLVGLP